ncbi:MAG: hypothetical protein LC790_11810, partial [Actinobacteria bacterium]|nr:hypothetical protein [Actinomycetota bacterium]
MSNGGAWPSGTCGSCGHEGKLGKRACAEHPDLCPRCYRAHQPRRECGICGRVRKIHIRARDGEPDICDSCQPVSKRSCGACGRVGRIVLAATADAPALGRCCYSEPRATCSGCGRDRPCVGARGPTPLCAACRKKGHTTQCVDCGQQRRVDRRVEGGVICAACSERRGDTCVACRHCASDASRAGGCCRACRLRLLIVELRERADPAAAAALEPFLSSLVESLNPASTLRRLQRPSFALLEQLLAGTIELSHAALDSAAGEVAHGRAVAFLRDALVHHGVLEPRDEHSTAFARWQRHAIDQIAPGADRAHVRAYAIWHVAHQLARNVKHERMTGAPQKYARSLINEAIKLVLWLHAQDLVLCDLRQDLIDAWITTGASTRRRARLFLAWLERGDITPALHVAWHAQGPPAAPLDDEQRIAALRRLLHDRDVDPRDRLAGCLLLLYAQPLTRTAALKTTDIALTTDAQTTITLAR